MSKFKPGDVVRIVSRGYSSISGLTVGSEHLIDSKTKLLSDAIYLKSAYSGSDLYFRDSELELVHSTTKESSMKFKKGDKVRVVSTAGAARNKFAEIGAITTVIRVDNIDATYPYLVDGGDVKYCWVRESNIELVEDTAFKVGDIVEVIPPATYRVGSRGIVSEVSSRTIRIRHFKDGTTERDNDVTSYEPIKLKLVTQTTKTSMKQEIEVGDTIVGVNNLGEKVVTRIEGNGASKRAYFNDPVKGGREDWYSYSACILVRKASKEIEVGDTVLITGNSDFTGQTVEIVKISGDSYYISVPGRGKIASSYTKERHGLTLVSKGSAQEVTGYELIKALPGIPVGTKCEMIDTRGKKLYKFVNGGNSNAFTAEQIADTTFFKPLYKAKETVLTLSGDRKLVIKDDKLLLGDGVEFCTIEHFAGLKKYLDSDRQVTTGRKNYPFTITEFTLGCQKFNVRDVLAVNQAIQKLK